MERSEIRATKTEVVSDHAVVAAGNELAAQIGAQILEQGGNVVDALVTAAFVTWVVEPENSGIGGLNILGIHCAGSRNTIAINGLQCLPLNATPQMFELEEGEAGWHSWRKVKDDAQMIGYRSVAVPGALSSLCYALERFGTMPLTDVIAPAIEISEKGFPVDGYLAMAIAKNLHNLNRFPTTAAIFTKGGLPLRPRGAWDEGDRLVQPDLADTYRIISRDGWRIFYEGEIAQAIIKHVQENDGILTLEDLASYEPRVVEPALRHSYRDCEYCSLGNVYLPEMLNILECFPLRELGTHSVAGRHLILETSRQAFIDVLRYVGDPEAVPTPLVGLTSKVYARELAGRINTERAQATVVPGDPWMYDPMPRPNVELKSGTELNGTTQIVAMDRAGNMAALCTTLGGAFGSMVTIPGTGIILNDGMVTFNPEPGKTNSIRGGLRPTPLAPASLYFKDGHSLAALSCSGGRRTVTAILQVALNLIDARMSIQEAISAPRVHTEGREALVDSRVGRKMIEALSAMGHIVDVRENTPFAGHFARIVGVWRDPKTGLIRGGCEPLLRAVAVAV